MLLTMNLSRTEERCEEHRIPGIGISLNHHIFYMFFKLVPIIVSYYLRYEPNYYNIIVK